MPVIEQQTSSGGGSGATMMLSFLLGLVIVAVALFIVLHGIMHLF